MKILVIAPAWVGDAVMAQPLYHYLTKQYPQVELDVITPSGLHALYTFMPEVDQIFSSSFIHGQLQLRQRWQLAQKIKKNNYQYAFILPNSLKSALIPWLAGIPRRIGYLGEYRYGLLTNTFPNQMRPQRMVDQFVALASNLTTSTAQPRLIIDKAKQTGVYHQFGLTLERPIAIFCPGAEYGPAKRWPSEHFAALSWILHQRGYQIWIVGSSKENLQAQDIALQGAPLHNLCGKTQLDEAIHLIDLATIVISNDSGLMHIAAALKRPLVALYGSSSPDFTPPLSPYAEIVSLNLACSPCFKRTCPLTHFNCMRQMDTNLVVTAIDKLTHRLSNAVS